MIDSPVVVGLAFGHRGTEPGKTNEAIARYVKAYSNGSFRQSPEEQQHFIIVQEEVARAFEEPEELEFESISGNMDDSEGEGYGDTRSVAEEMVRIIEEGRYPGSIKLICHPHHASRAKRVFEKLGFWVDVPKLSTNEIPYDSESKQWWTRGPLRWWLGREWGAMLVYKAKGYI